MAGAKPLFESTIEVEVKDPGNNAKVALDSPRKALAPPTANSGGL